MATTLGRLSGDESPERTHRPFRPYRPFRR